MENSVKDRFLQILRDLEKSGKFSSKTDLAKRLGYKTQAFSEILNGRTKLSLDLLQKFCKEFNVNPNYLLLNTGDVYLNNTNNANTGANKSANFGAKKSANSLPQSTNLVVSFPKTDINFDSDKALQVLENEGLTGRKVYISPEPAMAGYLGSYVSEGNEPLEWFYMPFLQGKGLYACFRVQGRSMEEYVLEGSWVVCRLLEEAWQIRSGNIHLVATKSEGVLLKRLRVEPKLKDKGIICYSDNPHYLPFFVPNEEILAVWAVEMFLQKEFPFTHEEAYKNLKNYLDNLEL